jgi:hypothetical protein
MAVGGVHRRYHMEIPKMQMVGGGGAVAVTREHELSMHSQAILRTPAHASHTMHLVR